MAYSKQGGKTVSYSHSCKHVRKIGNLEGGHIEGVMMRRVHLIGFSSRGGGCHIKTSHIMIYLVGYTV